MKTDKAKRPPRERCCATLSQGRRLGRYIGGAKQCTRNATIQHAIGPMCAFHFNRA